MSGKIKKHELVHFAAKSLGIKEQAVRSEAKAAEASQTGISCESKARSELNAMSAAALATFSAPMPPGGHTAALVTAQVTMVSRIGVIYGESIKGAAGAAIVQSIKASAGSNMLAIAASEAANLIPVFGWGTKAVIGSASVKAVGEAAIIYFERENPGKLYLGDAEMSSSLPAHSTQEAAMMKDVQDVASRVLKLTKAGSEWVSKKRRTP